VVFLKYYTHIPSQDSQVYILSDGFKKAESGSGVCLKQYRLIKMRRERRVRRGEGA
jgi:hypothetical protein